MTEEQLKNLAIEVTEGKVFGSWMIPEEKMETLLPIIFLPYHWGAAETIKDQDVSVLYEHMVKTKRKTKDGYPVFMSFKTLSKDECSRLAELVKKLNDMKLQFMGEENDEN